MEELKTIVSEQSSQLNAFHGREMKKERETASSPLSSKPVTPCCIHNTSPIPAENNNMMALVALGLENNQTINDLSVGVTCFSDHRLPFQKGTRRSLDGMLPSRH